MVAAAEALAVDLVDARALKFRATSGDRAALRDAAKQFEALMVTQMLKQMRQTRFNDEDDPLTGGDSLKLYQGLLDQQWAAKMTSGRGLGFADMLTKHLERQAGVLPEVPSPSQAPQTVNPAADTPEAAVEGGALSARGTAVLPAPARVPAFAPHAQAAPRALPSGMSPAGEASAFPGRKQTFLEALRPHAEAAEASTGVPANFILAQAALESGWGAKEIKGADGQASHNLFGIKAGAGWSGTTVDTTTTEYRQGLAMKLTQRFRAYDDYGTAFADYAQLLKRRFGEAVSTDADAFAEGLAKAGYATDPAYAGKLKAVIASVATADA